MYKEQLCSFTESLLFTMHYFPNFASVNSFNSHNNPMKAMLLLLWDEESKA